MDCDEMERVATYPPMIILLVVFMLIAIIAIPLIIRVIYRISSNHLYHRNTRILLVAHGIALIVHMINRLIFHGSDLYRWLVIMPKGSPCDVISTTERCFFMRIGFNCAMWFCVCTSPAITLERLIATYRIRSYQSDRKSWAMVLLFQILCASCLLVLIYSNTRFGGQTYYCMSASSNTPIGTLTAFVLTIILHLTSLRVFHSLIRKNKALSRNLHMNGSALIMRYQVEESLRALRTLSQPVHIMFAFKLVYCFISFFILNFNSYFSRPVYFFLMEVFILLPEYTIAFVVTFELKERSINARTTSTLKKNIAITNEAYFKHYREAW